MSFHKNNGCCSGCGAIFEMYPDFHEGLRDWFFYVQKLIPVAHISVAGRGRTEQERCKAQGLSRAKWLESAHNFNCAIDVFRQEKGKPLYDAMWYDRNIKPLMSAAPFEIEWYGDVGSTFYELPHFQVRYWRDLNRMPVEIEDDSH